MALSNESPLEPTEAMMFDSAKACPYLIDLKCVSSTGRCNTDVLN